MSRPRWLALEARSPWAQVPASLTRASPSIRRATSTQWSSAQTVKGCTPFTPTRAAIVVRLLKTSPVNSLLSALFAFQRSEGSVHGQNTIVINDSNRGDVITCRQVAFSKAPPLQYGKEAGLIEWDFTAVKIDITLAG